MRPVCGLLQVGTSHTANVIDTRRWRLLVLLGCSVWNSLSSLGLKKPVTLSDLLTANCTEEVEGMETGGGGKVLQTLQMSTSLASAAGAQRGWKVFSGPQQAGIDAPLEAVPRQCLIGADASYPHTLRWDHSGAGVPRWLPSSPAGSCCRARSGDLPHKALCEVLSLAASLPYSRIGVSWDHFPNELFSVKSRFRVHI